MSFSIPNPINVVAGLGSPAGSTNITCSWSGTYVSQPVSGVTTYNVDHNGTVRQIAGGSFLAPSGGGFNGSAASLCPGSYSAQNFTGTSAVTGVSTAGASGLFEMPPLLTAGFVVVIGILAAWAALVKVRQMFAEVDGQPEMADVSLVGYLTKDHKRAHVYEIGTFLDEDESDFWEQYLGCWDYAYCQANGVELMSGDDCPWGRV